MLSEQIRGFVNSFFKHFSYNSDKLFYHSIFRHIQSHTHTTILIKRYAFTNGTKLVQFEYEDVCVCVFWRSCEVEILTNAKKPNSNI